MATSKCSCCGSTYFELKAAEIANSQFKLKFIQCGSCGAVVGVTDSYNTSDLIFKLANKLNVDLER